MKKWLLSATVVFVLLILAVVLAANTDRLPRALERLSDFPGGDKLGHFLLFGLLSFLLNRSALVLQPNGNPARRVLRVSLILILVIGLEEWSQALFPARTVSLADLLASYAGVISFAVLAYASGRG